MPSPTCTVNSGATPVDVAASSSPTIALVSAAGVNSWFLTCIGTDETTTPGAINSTLVVNGVSHTATFTALGAGTGYVFQSTVGVGPSSSQGFGRDANNVIQPSYTTTFKVNVKAANGLRVISQNETFEQNSAFGWIDEENKSIRANSAGGPMSITGSGLWHSIAGVLQAAAYIGTAGQAMFTGAGATDVSWASFSGDVTASTATPGAITVTGIQGRAVASTAPTNGQTYTWNSGASQWQPGSATGLLTAYGGDLSSTSTSTAQYVDALSFNATGSGHGAGGAIPVNGTGTTLNWIDDVAKLQHVGATVLQLGQASGDFIAFGASPASSGILRVPSGATVLFASPANTQMMGTDSSNNLAMNVPTGSHVSLSVNSTNMLSLGASSSDFLVIGDTVANAASAGLFRFGSTTLPLTIQAINAGGGSNIPLEQLDASGNITFGLLGTAGNTGSNAALRGQDAKSGGGGNGGVAIIAGGNGDGAGSTGGVTFAFGGVSASNSVKFLSANGAAGLGTEQWSSGLTPLLTQAALASTSGTASNGIAFTLTAQAGQAATGNGFAGGVGGTTQLNAGRGGNASGASAPGGAGGNVVANAAPGGTGTSSNGASGYVDLQVNAVSGLRVEASGTSLIGGAGSYGSGTGVGFFANASVNPTVSPTGGAQVYASGGQLFARASGDTQGLKVGVSQAGIVASDQSVTSSTTLTNVTGPAGSVAMGASDTYIITWTLLYTMATSTGITVAVTVPTGATLLMVAYSINTTLIGWGTTGTSGNGVAIQGGATTQSQLTITATVKCDGTHSGSAQLQFTQQTNSGTATTIKAGSAMTAIKV